MNDAFHSLPPPSPPKKKKKKKKELNIIQDAFRSNKLIHHFTT